MAVPTAATAAGFRAALDRLGSGAADGAPPMRDVFALAKTMMGMPLDEVRLLLASDQHLHRVGAVSVMDFRARRPRVGDDERRALFDLYIGEHDRINAWDLVDRAAPHVVGGFVREAGKHDPVRLRAYLDRHVPGLPPTVVRHAIRHLPEDERQEDRRRAASRQGPQLP